MKKMMFLMLTFLIMGSASMNAQVQIGGTNGPDKSAVLDLNGDSGTATGGLALPRVALTANDQKLNNETPQPGTVVYNTSSTLAGEGAYVWTPIVSASAGSDFKGITQLTGDVTAPQTESGSAVATLSDNAVTSAKIKDGEVNTADLHDAAVTGVKIAAMGATNGQSLMRVGGAWVPDQWFAIDFYTDTIPVGASLKTTNTMTSYKTPNCRRNILAAGGSTRANWAVPVMINWNSSGITAYRPTNEATTAVHIYDIVAYCVKY